MSDLQITSTATPFFLIFPNFHGSWRTDDRKSKLKVFNCVDEWVRHWTPTCCLQGCWSSLPLPSDLCREMYGWWSCKLTSPVRTKPTYVTYAIFILIFYVSVSDVSVGLVSSNQSFGSVSNLLRNWSQSTFTPALSLSLASKIISSQ